MHHMPSISRRHLALRLMLLAVVVLLASGGACGGGSSSVTPAPPIPEFDADRAFVDLVAQCAFGPRHPGSTGHAQQLAWMKATLATVAERVVEQPFTDSTAFGGPYDFVNLLAAFATDRPGPVTMLAAHWDTRPVADQDPDPANRDQPILGANDGASGVAILLELARVFHAQPPPHPVYLVFLDAEDSGSGTDPRIYHGYCLGAAYLAQHWPPEIPRPERGILLDLVGGVAKHNPRVPLRPGVRDYFYLPVEPNSQAAHPALVEEIWTMAEQVGATAFSREVGSPVIDDHLPFIAVGIPTVNLIQFTPPVWHTLDDTPEYCSPSALAQVGKTLLGVLYSP